MKLKELKKLISKQVRILNEQGPPPSGCGEVLGSVTNGVEYQTFQNEFPNTPANQIVIDFNYLDAQGPMMGAYWSINNPNGSGPYNTGMDGIGVLQADTLDELMQKFELFAFGEDAEYGDYLPFYNGSNLATAANGFVNTFQFDFTPPGGAPQPQSGLMGPSLEMSPCPELPDTTVPGDSIPDYVGLSPQNPGQLASPITVNTPGAPQPGNYPGGGTDPAYLAAKAAFLKGKKVPRRGSPKRPGGLFESKKQKLNEQYDGWNEQGVAPLTGFCPEASLTINSPEELANLIGFDPNTGPEGAEGYIIDNPQYIPMAVQAAVNQQINTGDTIKVHASVFPYMSSIPVQVYNPFDGYGWAYSVLTNGVAMEPQIPDGYYNNDSIQAEYNPEYIFMNTTMGLQLSGQFRWCQYTQADAFCLAYGYGHTGYCPAPEEPVTPTPETVNDWDNNVACGVLESYATGQPWSTPDGVVQQFVDDVCEAYLTGMLAGENDFVEQYNVVECCDPNNAPGPNTDPGIAPGSFSPASINMPGAPQPGDYAGGASGKAYNQAKKKFISQTGPGKGGLFEAKKYVQISRMQKLANIKKKNK